MTKRNITTSDGLGKPPKQKLKQRRKHEKNILAKAQEKIVQCGKIAKDKLEVCFALLRKRDREVLMGLCGGTSKVLDRLCSVTNHLGSMRTLLEEGDWHAFAHFLISDTVRVVNLRKCIRCMNGEDKGHVRLFRRCFFHSWCEFLDTADRLVICIQQRKELLAGI